MSDRLDEIRARLAAATPGPWYVTEDLDEDDAESAVGVATGDPESDDYGMLLVTPGGGSFDVWTNAFERRVANATLAGHAPEDLTWCVTEIETLRREVRLREHQ